MNCTCGHTADEHAPLEAQQQIIGRLECQAEHCRCLQYVRSNL